MENTEDFLKQLEPILTQLNMQNLSKVNNNQAKPQNGTNNTNKGSTPVSIPIDSKSDAISQIIDQHETEATIKDIINSGILNSSKPTNAPKTNGGQPTTIGPVPVKAGITTKPAQTTVVEPTTNKQPTAIKYRPFTSAVTPDVINKYTKLYGVPDTNVTKAILDAAKTTGSDESILFKFAKAESSYDPKATAKTSSATGLFQILDGTWDYILHSLDGKKSFNLKGNKKDPYENAVAGAVYLNEIKKNMSSARKSGEFTPGELYLGHFAGPSTAAKAIKLIDAGKGNFKASEVFTPSQIKANKKIFYDETGKMRSVGQVASILAKKVA